MTRKEAVDNFRLIYADDYFEDEGEIRIAWQAHLERLFEDGMITHLDAMDWGESTP